MTSNILQSLFQNNFDQKIAALFLTIRSGFGIKIFSVISFFGNWLFLVPLMLLIIIILYLKNKKEFIIQFLLTVLSAEAVTFFSKILFHRGRPLLAVFHETDFSFPSGHATIAAAFYGYLAYIIIKSVKARYKRLIIISAVLIIGLIGFSRLYLGVHYLSDVLAGYLVGLTALIIGINSGQEVEKELKKSLS